MLIGVVSDTHNNSKNIETIITLFNQAEVSLVIHTGDIANALSLKRFSKLNCPLHGVYGNNDRCEEGLIEASQKESFQFQNPPKILSLKDKNIAIFHEPDHIEEFLTQNLNIHLVLHGHTHRYREEKKDGVIIFNPGESAGMQKGKNAIGIIDLESFEIKRIFF